MEYVGSLYIGERLQLVDMVWDTGSDWLVVASEQCETCNGQKYDSRQDLSYA